ncbi:hypothetical protein SPRG_09510 [Saprolegnia parasitica CBS 223.65]|uniref:Cilia- and flagella-associated protein 418 n=1 Tax=Saprolegnia parasitica (strain CBS 223.65) TaxID=695850 RepID=A0A067CEN2_SAPPC|nr:hypothetical protein SPRG_09510 [Saprolegnia parasitica CBS 223.65]KDO25262.1 hypothetical protein SPRG_09510 [Saprolegnia parasitica CBS 223.65]|eukprot:XP_012204095.1 hypothetical protein SPRG_09510 [Saprolegnia parasitica CBS 223.65]
MDFEDLLNEVESAVRGTSAPVKPATSSSYTSSKPSSTYSVSSAYSTSSTYSASSSSMPSASKPAPSSSSKSRMQSDLDDLLDLVAEPEVATYAKKAAPREFQAGSSKKCTNVALAGTALKHGQHVSAVNAAACSNLRCNDCDFTVVQFANTRWHASADYMFFRENVPNEAKLRAKMEPSSGCIAYACQCKWLSVSDKTTPERERVKWCCAGH